VTCSPNKFFGRREGRGIVLEGVGTPSSFCFLLFGLFKRGASPLFSFFPLAFLRRGGQGLALSAANVVRLKNSLSRTVLVSLGI